MATAEATQPKIANLGRPCSVEAMVRPFLIKKALTNERKYDYFHPSAWGICHRKIAYQYYNEKEQFLVRRAGDVDVRLERIFDNGHSTHARWQNYFDKAGILRGLWECPNPNCGLVYGREEKIGVFNPQRTMAPWKCGCGNTEKLIYKELSAESEPRYNFKGSVDAVIDVRGSSFEQGNKYDVFILDIKTINDEQYSSLSKAKDEHVVQVHIYMWLLDVHAAMVLYENKNNQSVKEMIVYRDEKIIDKIKEEADRMMSWLYWNKLPFRPDGFTRSQFPCRNCEFVRFCYR